MTDGDREQVNLFFRNLDNTGKRSFMLSLCERGQGFIRRTDKCAYNICRYRYFLPYSRGGIKHVIQIQVCKTFFLTTLGYPSSKDSVFKTVLNSSLEQEKDSLVPDSSDT